MAERPILFSGDMVRALIAGTKTQTRRVIAPDWWRCLDPADAADRRQALTMCPYGRRGDRLWCRETWAPVWKTEYPPEDIRDCAVQYRADWPNDKYPGHWPDDCGNDPDCGRWRPSIHMPRWASRITLEVISIRVQRLQEISEADARAEGTLLPVEPAPVPGKVVPLFQVTGAPLMEMGIKPSRANCYRWAYTCLWEQINGKRAPWRSNPWVWAISFKRVDATLGAAHG